MIARKMYDKNLQAIFFALIFANTTATKKSTRHHNKKINRNATYSKWSNCWLVVKMSTVSTSYLKHVFKRTFSHIFLEMCVGLFLIYDNFLIALAKQVHQTFISLSSCFYFISMCVWYGSRNCIDLIIFFFNFLDKKSFIVELNFLSKRFAWDFCQTLFFHFSYSH